MRKMDAVFISILSIILIFGLGFRVGYTWTGNTNTLSPGFLEVNEINATGYYWSGQNRTMNTLSPGFLEVNEINATGYYWSGQNRTEMMAYPVNSGATLSSNGTWVPHGLVGDPGTNGSITLSLRGPSAYNATWILRVPTVLSSNATHFQIEFTAWETVGWTQVAVTPVEAQTVYWFASYRP